MEMEFSSDTFVELGLQQDDADEMIQVLKPNETSFAMTSLQFIQFAKQIKKISGIDLLQYNSIDWNSFNKFVQDVKKGGIYTIEEKLKIYIVNFANYTTEVMRTIVRKTYENAQKVYSTVGKNVSLFITYLTSSKVVVSSIAMNDLHKAANKFVNIDDRIQNLYNECFFSYKTNILKHVKANRILDIEAYHIDHILAMLADLSFLIEEAKKKNYVDMMNTFTKKKNDLLQKKMDIEKTFEKKIKTQSKRVKYSGAAVVVGLFGLFLGISTIPAAVAVGLGAVCGGASYFVKRKLKKQRDKEIEKIHEELEKNQKMIDFWRGKTVWAQLNVLANNLKNFEKQMNIIKNQYDTKKNLKECGDDIALWLAAKNGHDKNVEKLSVYKHVLDELCVDTYQTFIQLEDEDIDNVIKDLEKKHRKLFLKQIRKIIVKYCHDDQLLLDTVKKFTRRS